MADYREAIGYTRLVEEFGDRLPDGTGISVAQIEFIRNETWAPQASGELSHVTFTYSPEATDVFSPHAHQVGRYFYGRHSLTPGVRTVHAFRANHWYMNLNLTKNLPPQKAHWRVENHSWGGTLGSPAIDQQVIARLDYRILTQNVFSSVGLDNNTRTMWPLLANSYNSIVVGIASGRHNRGGSTLYTTGRSKPDLVAPLHHTSQSIPVVASAATLLIARAEQEESLADATHPPVIKALLMAGATKETLPEWSNSPQRPLDPVYGTGSLNIYHSYKTLESGNHLPGNIQDSRGAGWNWNTTPATRSRNLYPLTIPSDWEGEFSAVLAWNAEPVPEKDSQGRTNWIQFTYQVDNLALRLWTTGENLQPHREIAASLSEIDNVQHIYATDLTPGTYALEVSGDTTDVPYGLAWRTRAIPREVSPVETEQELNEVR